MKRLILCAALALLLASCVFSGGSTAEESMAPPSLRNIEQITEEPPEATPEPEPPSPPNMSLAFGPSFAVKWIAQSYGTTYVDGDAYPFSGTSGYETRIEVARISDFTPTIYDMNALTASASVTEATPAPTSLLVEVLDREGAPIEEERPGDYHCRVIAEFETEERRDVVVFEFTMVIAGEPNVVMLSETVQQGDPIVVRIDNAVDYGSYLLRVPYLDKAIEFFPYTTDVSGGSKVVALAPTPVATVEGNYELIVEHNYAIGVFEADFDNKIPQNYEVLKTTFVRQDLQTTSQTQSLYTSANLESDNEKVRQARANPIPDVFIFDAFVYPLRETARVSTEFAQERYVNNVFQSRHSGIDLAAARGSDVLATASGTVVLADELIVNGNTVIIDHGLGVFSSYSHLDSMAVAVGDMINAGEVLGQVGSTGYSTGPHLHFTVMVNGYYVNPTYLMEHNVIGE